MLQHNKIEIIHVGNWAAQNKKKLFAEFKIQKFQFEAPHLKSSPHVKATDFKTSKISKEKLWKPNKN